MKQKKNHDSMGFIKGFSDEALLFLGFHVYLVYYNHITQLLPCTVPAQNELTSRKQSSEDGKTHTNAKETQVRYQNNPV